MAIYVEVLYADLTRQRKPIGEIDQLPTDGVLCIAVQTDAEQGKRKNIAVASGKDTYAFCQRRAEGQDWIMLCGWDDGDFAWRRLENVHELTARREVNAPLGCMRMIFNGQHVEADVWARAQEIFDGEIL